MPGKPWNYDMPIGHNLLKTKLKDMFSLAGLNHENISDHSLRATAITRLYDGGIREKMIMERSGHFSIAGVRSYECTTSLQQKEPSDSLSSKTKCIEDQKILKELHGVEYQ